MPTTFIRERECWKEGEYPFEDEPKGNYECEKCNETFNWSGAIEHSVKEQHHSFKLKGSNLSLNIG
jgi:hypothetical protein